jgi:hypothetical protein
MYFATCFFELRETEYRSQSAFIHMDIQSRWPGELKYVFTLQIGSFCRILGCFSEEN